MRNNSVVNKRSSSRVFFSTLFCGVAVAVVAPQSAWAQAVEDVGSTIGESDIVVTAQRRSESLSKVPVAVTVIGSEELETRQLTDIKSLQRLAPTLTVAQGQCCMSPFIRGIGSAVVGAGAFNSVGIYLDEVYVGNITGGQFGLEQAEQIQVLSGPQGALYGRNAVGGAVVISSPTPQAGGALSSSLSASFGNYDQVLLRGSVTSGLGDNVGLYLSGSLNRHDGYIRNLNAPGTGAHREDFDDRDSYGVVGALLIEPTDNLTLLFRGSHYRQLDYSGSGYQVVGQDIIVPGTGLNGSQLVYAGVLTQLGYAQPDAFAAAAQLRFAPQGGRATYDNERNGVGTVFSGPHLPGSFNYFDIDIVSLTAKYAFAGMELTSITAFNWTDATAAVEIMLADPQTYPVDLQGGSVGFTAQLDSRDFQQQLTLMSTQSPIKWIVGGMYFNQHGPGRVSSDLPVAAILTADNRYRVISKAVFAQVTIPLGDRFAVTAGGRYTDEKYTQEDFFPVGNTGTKSQENSKFTYNLRLEYSRGPLLLYGGISSAFKGGAFNGTNTSTPAVLPENITAAEVGFKIGTPRFQLNGAAYYYDYNAIQLSVADVGSGAAVLVNGASSKPYGAELSGLFRANEWLTLRGSIAAERARYRNDVAASTRTTPLATGGKRLVGAPELVITAGADLQHDTEAGKLKLSADVLHNGGYFHDPVNLTGTGGVTAADYTTLDASLTFKSANGPWRLSVYATNLTDARYYTNSVVIGGFARLARLAAPRTYGVTFGLDF